MKSFSSNLFRRCAIPAALALTSLSLTATPAFTSGTLSVVFYSYEQPETGAPVVGDNTYIVNLGPGHVFRANSATGATVSAIAGPSVVASANIGPDLLAAFGEDWAESGKVRWAVVGAVYNGSPAIGGDTQRTAYFSQARPSLTTGATGPGTTISNISTTNLGNIGTKTKTLFDRTNETASGPLPLTAANAAAAIIPTTALNTIDEFLPPVDSLFFGQGVDPRQTFGAGKIVGGTDVEGALDIYRFLSSVTNGSPTLTAAQSTGNAVANQGQFIGTLTIDASGLLRIFTGPPSAGNYASWATTNGVTGGPGGDSDNDGITNLVEYALSTNLTGFSSVSGLSGGAVSFNKRSEAATNNDVSYVIEVSEDLGTTTPWQTVTPTTNTASLISYTLPTAGPKLFARLKVSVP